MFQEFNKYWIKNQKSAYEMIKEIVDEQRIKLKEENMEDRNKTVAQLIADLQNELDKANNRIIKLVKENNKLTNENMILDEVADYCANDVLATEDAFDSWNENNKINNEIEKLKNENEYLEGIIDWVISENDDMSKEITKWHNKYTKEKAKHDKATKKIDELKKHQKGELAWSWSDKRRHDNLDSLLYSYWGLKEYYQEAKCNKNEANDVKE